MLLIDKITVVTGAAQGIGEGIAQLFSTEGSIVALCDINETRVSETADRIAVFTGRTTKSYKLDVTDGLEVRAVVNAIDKRFGKIDILVNCAGILEPVPFLEMSEEVWNRHFNVNVKGAFLMSQAVSRIMYQKGGCKIVNISSDSGVTPFPHEAAYASSKAALLALTRAVAKDLGAYGIYCNAICPGAVLTPMLRKTYATSDEELQAYIEATALKRIAQPEDVAAVALFLASRLSDHVTGEYIMATAGAVMSQ